MSVRLFTGQPADRPGRLRSRVVLGAVVAILVSAGAVLFRFAGSEPYTPPAIPGMVLLEVGGAGDHTSDFVVYEQDPPAGGPHHPVWQNCGLYAEPVRNEHAVHSLEHGAVWIAYHPEVTEDELAVIRGVVGHHHYTLASPYPGLLSRVVLTAWGYQLSLGTVEEAEIERFVHGFSDRRHAPEQDAPCTGGIGNPELQAPPTGGHHGLHLAARGSLPCPSPMSQVRFTRCVRAGSGMSSGSWAGSAP